MPDFKFCGPGPYDFPASRDAYGVPLGTVKPGDVLRLDEPPGPWWVPYEGDGETGGEGEAGAADEAAAAPPVEVAVQTSEAGVTGSEEG